MNAFLIILNDRNYVEHLMLNLMINKFMLKIY